MQPGIYVQGVRDRAEAYVNAGLWARPPTLRPNAWLNNFPDEDRHVAAFLLNSFLFYSNDATDRLILAAFSNLFCGPYPDRSAMAALKRSEQIAVCPVQGEQPSPSDSGNFVCRRARQLNCVGAAQIMDPDNAVRAAQAGKTIVMLDDFLGSGDQFLRSLARQHSAGSFAETLDAGACIYYVPLVATAYGIERIERQYPVTMLPVHVLDEAYRVTSDAFRDTSQEPALAAEVPALLRRYGAELDTGFAHLASLEARAFGYHSLGLTFSFEHSIPDATLPLFWATARNGWTPLKERR